MPEILQDRLARLLDPETHLRLGAGKGANGTVDVCVMQATDWLVGRDGTSDAPPCVDPVLRGFAMRLNDSARFAEWRDELKPFAPRLANTNADLDLSRKRAYMCADWAVREIAPLALEKRFPEDAAALRALPPIVDATTAEQGRAAARKAQKNAAYAYAYADAAATADAAYAYAAAAAAYAYADATADAAYADATADAAYADAAADAAYADATADAAYAYADATAADAYADAAADARRPLWESALAMLDRLIEARL